MAFFSPDIDVVSWNPQSGQHVFAWKFRDEKHPKYSNNLSTYTQLIVAESQEAILFSKGQIVGKFGPGKHTLNTENLPLLRSLFGIPFTGGKNPFTAEVWFVNKLMPLNIDWSTDSMMYHDPDYNTMVPLVAKGRYGIRITNAEKFLIKFVGTSNSFTASELTDQFFGPVVAKTKSTILQFIMGEGLGLKKISAYLDPISKNLMSSIQVFWEDYGFELHNFYVTSIDVDDRTEIGERIKKSMGQQSAQSIAGYTWQQSQAFELGDKAIDTMGNSSGSGGLLGAVLATNMMNSHGSGAMMQPPAGDGNSHNASASTQRTASPANPSTVYCSNCAKKFSSDMKFCPHCGDRYDPCPKCGTDNDPSAKRCVSCGHNLNMIAASCPQCSASLEPGSSFCSECGSSLTQKEGACSRCGFDLKGSAFCPQCGLKNR
ncbi:MAG: SPFH domain-containing protein [Flavobacteriales bacterium]|nr:SPFH domain-containing protein [Flavobacteriales bacterium]